MKHKLAENVIRPSGKGWLQIIKRGIGIAGSAAGVLLTAPLRLPSKILNVARYIALIAGIVKATAKTETDE